MLVQPHGLRRYTTQAAVRLSTSWQRLAAALGVSSGADRDGLPRAFLGFLLLFGAGMLLISLISDQGLLAYLRMQSEVSSLREEVQALESRQGDLEHRIQALRDDPDYIELLARRNLGLVRPGDRIYQLPLPDRQH